MRKKIVFDILLNIVAATVPLVILQLIIYPYLAKSIGQNQFGYMVTIFALITLISNSFGNILNNVRLLNEAKYNDKDVKGDYNIIMSLALILNIILIGIGVFYYSETFRLAEFSTIVLVGVFTFINAYIEVDFRLKLDYKKILINKMMLTLGYAVGALLFYYTKSWASIFLFGQVISFIYLFFKTNLLKEPFRFTECFRFTVKDCLFLLVATILANAVTYADRLLLFPLLGGEAVSIYYVSTLIGKIIGMGITPINSVVLSYLAKIDRLPTDAFKWVVTRGGIVCVAGYFICVAISRPVLTLLFPQWIDEVMRYIPVTTITVVLTVMCGMLNPFILKYSSRKWQIVINGVSLGAYLGLALLLYQFWGLMGFCVGTSIGALIKLIVILIIYYSTNQLNMERK